MSVIIKSLYRYPVKGLSPEPLDRIMLEAGGYFPGDRLFAIENGPSGFDRRAAEHLPKTKYLMLMRHERLARFKSKFDDETAILSIMQGNAVVASGNLLTEAGCRQIEAFFTTNFRDELQGSPKILAAPTGYCFMDSRAGFLSIIDRASIGAIAHATGRSPFDPLRFRANVYVEGLGAWGEFGLVGRKVKLGEAVLEITKRIDRCAATDVEPATGVRNLRLVQTMEQAFKHHDCGVYARILEGGFVQNGDMLTPF